MCFHKAICFNLGETTWFIKGAYRRTDGMVTAESVMGKEHGRLPTASIMLTRPAADKFAVKRQESQQKSMIGDLYMQAYGVNRAGAYYINSYYSLYREYVPGSWSDRHKHADISGVTKKIDIIETYISIKESEG